MSKWSAYDAFTRDELREMSRAIQYGEISWVTIMDTRTDYERFIASKRQRAATYGFEPGPLNGYLKPWQADIVRWACRRGRAALFEECGLGKTIQQLEWARQIVRERNGRVLIHAPVGVRSQTVREAAKFGIDCDVRIVDDNADCGPGINICNYEKLHKIDPSQFLGVVLDESSILKSYTGSTKRALLKAWRTTPLRLACTATPAPNDLMELGNHADFLGVMPSNEMLSRWFINDTMKAGGYRLKQHAQDDFWGWVASWAVAVTKPSDVGGSDDGYDLPPLKRIDHVVEESAEAPPGMLFANYELSATNVHKQKRSTTPQRARKVAELVANEIDHAWIIWCDTNYEADELARVIPDAVDIRGSDSAHAKEGKLLAFSSGDVKRIITKPTVAGFGMNWQHCDRMAFVGLSYSFEQYYQAVRRCWRFGQNSEVHAHVVMSEGEAAIARAVERKGIQHHDMTQSMANAMHGFTNAELKNELLPDAYKAVERLRIPEWLLSK